MAELQQLDRTYHFILETFVERGRGPHFTEIARHFTVSPEAGRRMLHDLMGLGLPNFLFPGTDLIAGFAPFSNLPTHYRVTVDGQQKWFAECGFEAPAVCWLFPGKTIQIDAPCLDCGEPLRLAVRDGVIESQEPAGIYSYVDLPWREWKRNWAYA